MEEEFISGGVGVFALPTQSGWARSKATRKRTYRLDIVKGVIIHGRCLDTADQGNQAEDLGDRDPHRNA